MCHVPSRAGKTRKAAAELQLQQTANTPHPASAAVAAKRARPRQIA
jgi:hypothetical protein